MTSRVAKPQKKQAHTRPKPVKDTELPPEFVQAHIPQFVAGVQHILRQDPSLYEVIVQANFDHYMEPAGAVDIRAYWLALVKSVVSQQISGSAAAAIFGRFLQLFDDEPTPTQAVTFTPAQLREIGLSAMKVSYVAHISTVFSDPDSNLTKPEFYANPLPEIIAELVKLRGIGEWSAKMFAIFTLNEWDVFAHDDLGIARGASRYLKSRPDLVKLIKAAVSEDDELKLLLKRKGKFMSKSKRDWTPYHDAYLIYLSQKFSPYRSILMLVFWRLAATNIDVLEKKE